MVYKPGRTGQRVNYLIAKGKARELSERSKGLGMIHEGEEHGLVAAGRLNSILHTFK